jgi:hypothetical protein
VVGSSFSIVRLAGNGTCDGLLVRIEQRSMHGLRRDARNARHVGESQGKEGTGHIAGFALINGIRKTDKFDSE